MSSTASIVELIFYQEKTTCSSQQVLRRILGIFWCGILWVRCMFEGGKDNAHELSVQSNTSRGYQCGLMALLYTTSNRVCSSDKIGMPEFNTEIADEMILLSAAAA